tara:strand:+ start:4378 stop:4671 length:294 start_codon:yes stop_codon:yes gene_type:complete
MNQLTTTSSNGAIDPIPAPTKASCAAATFEGISKKLIEKQFRPSTVGAYTQMFRKFLKAQYPRPMHHITLDIIRDYQIDLIVEQNHKFQLSRFQLNN